MPWTRANGSAVIHRSPFLWRRREGASDHYMSSDVEMYGTKNKRRGGLINPVVGISRLRWRLVEEG